MEAGDKQKSVIEFIESVSADDENSITIVSDSASDETEERKEINLELSLGGCYSENKASNEGGRNVGMAERSNPNPSDIVKDAGSAAGNHAFLRAISTLNSEICRFIQSQGDGNAQIVGSSLLPTKTTTYPDTMTLGNIPLYPMQEGNRIPIEYSNPSIGVLAMTQLQSYLPQFIKGTPGFSPSLPFKNTTRGASTSGVNKDLLDQAKAEPASKRARTAADQGGERSNAVPRVITDGGNPNGVIIHGFLGRYTKDQVFICCACHHRVLTPAEFVKHAGGGDVENPGQLIKMVYEVEQESNETGN